MNIAEENARARAKAGVRTITHEELQALTNSTPTALKAASNIFENPPDGYAIALAKLPSAAPTVAATAPTHHERHGTAPDGYRIALDEIARQKSNPSTPSPASSVAPPDSYKIALDKQRKEKK